MELLLAATLCSLILPAIVLAFILPPGLAWGWMRIKSVVIVGKGFDTSKAVGAQEELPEICERPYIVDFNDPLAVTEPEPTEDEARIARIKERMKKKTTPTLPGKGQTSYVPIRPYKDRQKVEQDHELQIIKNH